MRNLVNVVLTPQLGKGIFLSGSHLFMDSLRLLEKSVILFRIPCYLCFKN